MIAASRPKAAPFAVQLERKQPAQAPSEVGRERAPVNEAHAQAELLRWLQVYFGVELG